MKRILLASASLVAFAGAAKADFDISGTAVLGWNDDYLVSEGHEEGFFNDFDFDVNFSQELDYGVTAAVRIGFEYVDSDGDSINTGHDDFGSFTDNNFLLSLTSDMGGLYFGDTTFAPETYWDGVTNMEYDGFSEQDGETALRGEVMFGGITAGVSYVLHNDAFAGDDPATPITTVTTGVTPAVTAPVYDSTGTATGDYIVVTPAMPITMTVGDESGVGTGELDQFAFGATGSVGAFTFSAAYQEETDNTFAGNEDDFNMNQVWGVAVGASYFGADFTLAYSDEEDVGSSTGVEISYPVGPLELTAFYVNNETDSSIDAVPGEPGIQGRDDNWGVEVAYASGPFAVTAHYHDGWDEEAGVEGSYELGNGLTFFAGYIDERENGASQLDQAEVWYVAAEADLGGGASLLISYADVNEGPGGVSTDLDEIGANDYYVGTTVQLSLDF